ncbi:hypothetical protein JH25_21040 [Pseudomonas sp. BRG-100]|nr:hypothetical protein JH25_21040 [Pseudomonas sp. BRG-100]
MTMDPISMAAGVMGAIPMVAGIADKGMDLANGAMGAGHKVLDMANKVLDMVGEGARIGGEQPKPQGQINFS